MKNRIRLILWDLSFVVGVVLVGNLTTPRYQLIAGISTILILTNCITNHLIEYKLRGKIY